MPMTGDTALWAMQKVRDYWAAPDPNAVLHAYNDVQGTWAAQHPGEPMPFTLDELINTANAESAWAFTLMRAGVNPPEEAHRQAAAKTDAAITGGRVVPYNGKGIYESRNATTGAYEYFLSATGAQVPFDPSLWDLGQGAANHGEPGELMYARAYAHWLSPWIGAAFDAANPT